MIQNSAKGKRFYGMHFYPGVAQYDDPDRGSHRIFLNEDTLRKMDESFSGCPVFVEHVDEVDDDIEVVKNEADGWVLRSFYNPADGKHWAEFVLVSERAIAAVEKGYKLSNAFVPVTSEHGGEWNGVSYQETVLGGDFEHLAIVKHPRYEESVIMTPKQFQDYNEGLALELKRITNSKEKKMGFKFFERQAVKNSSDLEKAMVELPLSKKEMTIAAVLNAYDKILNMAGYADGQHMVKLNDDEEMSVNDLVKKHMDCMNEMEEMKAANAAREAGGEPGPDEHDEDEHLNSDDEDDTISEGEHDLGDHGGDDGVENEVGGDSGAEGKDEKKKDKSGKVNPKHNKNKKLNAAQQIKELELRVAKLKAERLKNANLRRVDNTETACADLPQDQLQRGQQRYGSGN